MSNCVYINHCHHVCTCWRPFKWWGATKAGSNGTSRPDSDWGQQISYWMSVVSTAFGPYLFVENLFYQNMAIGFLLKKWAIQHTWSIMVEWWSVLNWLPAYYFSIYLGGRLDLHAYLYKCPIILKCIKLEPILALCSCHHHVVTLLLKVVALLFSLFVKVIALLVTYFQLTGLLSSHVLAEPCLVVLKHYGKKGGTASNRPNGRLFRLSLWVWSRGHWVNQEGERGQCCGAWPMGLWHQCRMEKDRGTRPSLQRRAPWMLLCTGLGQMRNIPGCRHASTVMGVIS